MKTGFLITGLVLLLLANLVMVWSQSRSSEGFSNYFLENAGGAGKEYKPIGAFDNVDLTPVNAVSSWRYTAPNESLLGPEFQPGPDSLFIFKNNQAKPEQRNYINMRGGNRTMEDGV